MPLIRSLASAYYTCVVVLILLLGKIMLIYSHCTEKKLVYIIIAALFSTYTILFIKFITPTPFSPFLSLKSSFISKLLIKGMLCPILI